MDIALDLLKTIKTQGFEAYLVGGFVRDYLLGKSSLDIDICTSALPGDLEHIFHLKPNAFGGINFKQEDYQITITPYREDMVYRKGFPKKVNFNVDLMTDLKRRDFTINAICMDEDKNIIDYHKGLEDLNNKTIKMIGDADTRIKEDPLRIIRALRFAVTLNFNLDENLVKAIKNNKDLLDEISAAKKEKEIAKLMKEPYQEKALNLITDLGLKEIIFPKI